MMHPFNLDLSSLKMIDLTFETPLTNEEAQQIGGGRNTTKAIGEEGGWDFGYRPVFKPRPHPFPLDKPPMMTTMALGEEGGFFS
jgi:hypothetical protein